MMEDAIFNYNVHDRFIHYTSLFFRKKTRDRKETLGWTEKKRAKIRRERRDLYCINAIPRNLR